MKQHTTPEIKIDVAGAADLLQAADRIVAAIKHGDEIMTIEGDRLSVDGTDVSFRLTSEETGNIPGNSVCELTLFFDDRIFKTNSMTLSVEKSVWSNGD